MNKLIVLLASFLMIGCGVYQTIPTNTTVKQSWVIGSEGVLVAKKRCGFLDLGRTVTVTGMAIRVKNDHSDGDWSILVRPDPQKEWLLKPWLDFAPVHPYIKAEFMPRENSLLDVHEALMQVKKLCNSKPKTFMCETPVRVAIRGRWAWDGVDHGGDWLKEQAKRCVDGRDPDPSIGWPEIHPATELEIEGYPVVPLTPEGVLLYMTDGEFI